MILLSLFVNILSVAGGVAPLSARACAKAAIGVTEGLGSFTTSL